MIVQLSVVVIAVSFQSILWPSKSKLKLKFQTLGLYVLILWLLRVVYPLTPSSAKAANLWLLQLACELRLLPFRDTMMGTSRMGGPCIDLYCWHSLTSCVRCVDHTRVGDPITYHVLIILRYEAVEVYSSIVWYECCLQVVSLANLLARSVSYIVTGILIVNTIKALLNNHPIGACNAQYSFSWH